MERHQKTFKDDLTVSCTNAPCDSWHPPVCQKYKTQAGCKFGEECAFLQRPQRTKTGGGKGSVALIMNVKQAGCASQDAEPPKVKSILRKVREEHALCLL